MESKTKNGFSVIQLVEIPLEYIRKGVLDALEGRESFSDTDANLNEKIYPADVFNNILEEQEGLEGSPIAMKEADLKQVEAFAKEFENFELVRVNTI